MVKSKFVVLLFCLFLSCLFIVFKGAIASVPTNGLVGYWNFDDGSGATAHDTSGNNNNGTITDATWSTGKVGRGGLQFNGSAYVTIPRIPVLEFGTGGFSVGAWFRSSSNIFGHLISSGKVPGSPGWCLVFGVNGSGLQMRIADGAKQYLSTTSPAKNDGNWHYAMGIVDRSASLLHLYIDGVEITPATSIAGLGSVTDTSTQVDFGALGGANPSQFYTGSLDDVRIYNRALSAQEVLDIYNNDVGPVKPAPSKIQITLDPSVRHQKISGWEYTDGLPGGDNSQTYTVWWPRFNQYKDSLYDQAADLGLNRVRFGFSGGIEGPDDGLWAQYLAGKITVTDTYRHVTKVVSSNRHAKVLDLSGFQFASTDFIIRNMTLPMKQRLEARGEKLYFIGYYSGFRIRRGSLHSDPAFYARFVLAVFEHMKQTFGFVPDIWEIINEPENCPDWVDGSPIGPAMVKTAAVLAAHGYHPKFSAPSPSFISNAFRYFNEIRSVRKATSLLSEFTYHYYNVGWTVSQLQQIGALGVHYGFDTGMNESAGAKSGYLHADLKYANNSFWMEGGLADVNYEPNNAAYFVVDAKNNVAPESNTLVFRQYFHYIRPGAVRIDANSQNAKVDPLAFINANGSYVVVIKTAAAEKNITVSNLPTGTYGITDSLGRSHADYNVTNGTLSTQISGAGYLTIFGITSPHSGTTSP